MVLKSKRVFVIGGSGFIGYHAIWELVRSGYSVSTVCLPPAPPADVLPPEVKVFIQDIQQASDSDLVDLFRGHDAIVFLAGMDDRVTTPKPAYPYFHRQNVENTKRTLILASRAGIKRAVVAGSYFTHFNRLWPEMKLAHHHPYIKSRLVQEQVVASIPGLDTVVLEIPYTFGAVPYPDWKPLWAPLVRYVRSSRIIFFTRGGTACVSVRTIGQAITAAIQRGQAGANYPIGGENLTWTEMLTRLAHADGRSIKVIRLPNWLVRISFLCLGIYFNIHGKEPGLNPIHYAKLQSLNTFIDPAISQSVLRYEINDLDEAFKQTVAACPYAD